MAGRISDEIRNFIVTQLAMYEPPQSIALAVKEEFGVVVDRRMVWNMDPTRASLKNQPAKKWRVIFASVREHFLEEKTKVPGAQRAVRLQRLDSMAVRAQLRGNFALARELNKQLAEEVGDVFTNKRQLTGKDGEKLFPEMTKEQRRAAALEIFSEAKEARDLARKDKAAAKAS